MQTTKTAKALDKHFKLIWPPGLGVSLRDIICKEVKQKKRQTDSYGTKTEAEANKIK